MAPKSNEKVPEPLWADVPIREVIRYKSMRVLILIDEVTLPHLVNGMPPSAPYSHDKNLFQFAHESLRKGLTVMFAGAQSNAIERPYWIVNQVYPTWQQEAAPIAYGDVKPDIIAAVFPEALNIRREFPHAKIVAIHAAVHWIESPLRFPAQYVYDLITAVRYNIDFIITQNERMAEILYVFYGLLAKWQNRDRILVSPLGIVPEEVHTLPARDAIRRDMGVRDDEIAIINSGGIWRWTDFNTFLRAYCDWNDRNDSPFRLFIMGIVQPNNIDHDDYVAETEAILLKYRQLVGTNIHVYNNWHDASKRVQAYTSASDIGLNVNLPSLENWQSYRLRFLDYMYFGLPAINTAGDILSEIGDGNHVFRVIPGEQESYEAVLDEIANDPAIVRDKAQTMRDLAARFDSRQTYGKVIDRIIEMGRRPGGDHGEWGDCVLDYANQVNRRETREAIESWIHGSLAAALGA